MFFMNYHFWCVNQIYSMKDQKAGGSKPTLNMTPIS